MSLDKKKPKPKTGNLVEKHGFEKVMGAFLAVKPKNKNQKPKAKQKQKRRSLKKWGSRLIILG